MDKLAALSSLQRSRRKAEKILAEVQKNAPVETYIQPGEGDNGVLIQTTTKYDIVLVTNESGGLQWALKQSPETKAYAVRNKTQPDGSKKWEFAECNRPDCPSCVAKRAAKQQAAIEQKLLELSKADKKAKAKEKAKGVKKSQAQKKA